MRARAVIEERESSDKSQIVVTELPYQVNGAKLVRERSRELVRDKKLEGISDLRNESDRDGMRIVIELKRDAIPRVVLNQLYKHTPMQTTFGVIMLALVPDAQTRQLVPQGHGAQGDARALHHAPPRRHRPAHAVRARQGARARAHPRRPQDRRRQHRRGDQAHPQGRGHADGERAAAARFKLVRAAGRSDPQHAAGEAHRPRDREARRRAQGSARRSIKELRALLASQAAAHEAAQGGAGRGRREVRRRAPHARSRATRASSRSRT